RNVLFQLKELLRTPKHGPKDKVEFHSSRTVKKVDVPFLRLSKQRQTMAKTVEHDHLCPQHVAKQDILKIYTQEISSLSKKHLTINCTIDFIDKCEEGLQFIEGKCQCNKINKFIKNREHSSPLAIFLEVPESWGKIEPIMVGHVDRRQNKRTAMDIVCFPECPYPVIAAASESENNFTVTGQNSCMDVNSSSW
ncbi:unnamed protein product, partial [Timema podura]|nr:unnamed protein product [Timema podura]